MPFLTTAAIVGGTLAAGIGGAAISAHAAGQAAQAQSEAAMNAAQLQRQSEKEALAFQKQEFATQQANEAPFLKAGQGAIGQLSALTQPGGQLLQPWTEQFVAPTNVTEQNDPGYQFRLDEMQKAIERGAAAKGGLLSGGTAKDLANYEGGLASQEYGNVYNRALGEYQQRYNIFNQNNTNTFNRLGALAGIGQTSAGQLGQFGSQAANNISNTLLTSGQQIGNDYLNAGAARASGYVGGANAIAGGLTGTAGNLTNLYLLSQLGLLGQPNLTAGFGLGPTPASLGLPAGISG